MTNCFFDAIKQAFNHKDLHQHFPRLDNELPSNLFEPYFRSLESLVSLLFKLADFLECMYGYTTKNDGSQNINNKNKTIYNCLTHVLLNNEKVSDRIMGDFVYHLISKEVKLEDMLKKGYYDGQGADPILVLLCEFTGISIDVEIPTMSQVQKFPNQPATTIQVPKKHFLYQRLNTTCHTKVYLRFTKGHASFLKRETMNKTNRKRKIEW